MHQSWMVVGLCIGIVIGAVIGFAMRINYFVSPVWIVLVVVLLAIGYIKPRLAFVVIALVVGMIMAFVRVASELVGQDYINQLLGKDVLVIGEVKGDPEYDDGEVKMKISNLGFGDDEIKTSGSIYVKVGEEVDVRQGDKVILKGKLLNGFGTYAGYLYKPVVKRILRPEPGSWVLGVRNWFADMVRKVVPEEEAQLGLSYLLGMKTGLSSELSENLRMVGLTHIVVASGAHLSILVEVARRMFGRLSRFSGLLFSVIFVVFFMAMVGWTPSILRAGIMAILTLVSWYVGRKIAPWRLILMVAAFTLMLEPSFIVNLGWLLSFASYAGIMMLGPWMKRFFYGERKPGFVGSTVLTTVAATVMTLPLVLYYYGTMSLISVVANLLILPTLPWAMGLVFVAGVLAVVPWVSVVVGWCTKILLDFHIAVVGWFGGMRGFLVEIGVGHGWVFGVYVVIVVIGGFYILKKELDKRKKHGTIEA